MADDPNPQDQNQQPASQPANLPASKSMATKFRELVVGGKLGPIQIGVSANFNSRIGPGLEANIPIQFGRNRIDIGTEANVGIPDKGQYPIGVIHYQALFRRRLFEQPVSDDSISTRIDLFGVFRHGRSAPSRFDKTDRKRPVGGVGLEIDERLDGIPTHLTLKKLPLFNVHLGPSEYRFIPQALRDRDKFGVSLRTAITGFEISNKFCSASDPLHLEVKPQEYDKACSGSDSARSIAAIEVLFDVQHGGNMPNRVDWLMNVRTNPDGIKLFLQQHEKMVPRPLRRLIK